MSNKTYLEALLGSSTYFSIVRVAPNKWVCRSFRIKDGDVVIENHNEPAGFAFAKNAYRVESSKMWRRTLMNEYVEPVVTIEESEEDADEKPKDKTPALGRFLALNRRKRKP